jgi:hypothetical protein
MLTSRAQNGRVQSRGVRVPVIDDCDSDAREVKCERVSPAAAPLLVFTVKESPRNLETQANHSSPCHVSDGSRNLVVKGLAHPEIFEADHKSYPQHSGHLHGWSCFSATYVSPGIGVFGAAKRRSVWTEIHMSMRSRNSGLGCFGYPEKLEVDHASYSKHSRHLHGWSRLSATYVSPGIGVFGAADRRGVWTEVRRAFRPSEFDKIRRG